MPEIGQKVSFEYVLKKRRPVGEEDDKYLRKKTCRREGVIVGLGFAGREETDDGWFSVEVTLAEKAVTFYKVAPGWGEKYRVLLEDMQEIDPCRTSSIVVDIQDDLAD